MFSSITMHANTRTIILSQTKGHLAQTSALLWPRIEQKHWESLFASTDNPLFQTSAAQGLYRVCVWSARIKKALYKECHVSTSWKAAISFNVLQFLCQGKQ